MALQQEIWVQDIMDNLYLDSQFVNMSTSHDAYVDKKIVHVPQAGSAPNVAINRTALPATIAQRVDNDFTYQLSEYSTDPVLITHIDELQISYDKRQSVMMNNYKLLSQTVGDQVANVWSPAGANNIIRTSGAAGATLAPSATGTRKAITIADVAALNNKLDMDLVPTDGRVLMLPSQMFWELMATSEVVRASYNGFASQPNVLATGVIAELLGFKIMRRPRVNVFTATPTLKAVGVAGAATDNLGALAWHPGYVAKALGSVTVFSDSGDNGQGKPEYYGVLLSALVMLGATVLRTDTKGVVNLVQG